MHSHVSAFLALIVLFFKLMHSLVPAASYPSTYPFENDSVRTPTFTYQGQEGLMDALEGPVLYQLFFWAPSFNVTPPFFHNSVLKVAVYHNGLRGDTLSLVLSGLR